jgi:hypothetical protein
VQWAIETEGVNLRDLWPLGDILDLNKLKTNDIYRVLQVELFHLYAS